MVDPNHSQSLGTVPRFRSIALHAVRCFETAHIDLHPKVTVIIGENGAGKTTLAEAFASLVGGEEEGLSAFPLRHGHKNGSIELRDDSNTQPVASWSHGPNRSTRQRLPRDRLVLAYGRYRRVETPAEALSIPGGPMLLGPDWSDEYTRARLKDDLAAVTQRRRTATLTRPDNHLMRDLAEILRYLGEHRGDPVIDRIWNRVSESVKALGEGLDGIDVRTLNNRSIPVVRRRGVPLELRELSDGYQAVLVIVFDLVLRFLNSFPLLQDPLSAIATVLIDEIDLHLHPRWQRAVVGQLADLFPGTQFILTTHSPSVIQGAIDNGYLIVTLSEKGGAAKPQAKNLDDLDGAQIGSVLVDSRLFALPSRYSNHYEAIERKAQTLRRKIQRDTATPQDRKRLLEALDQLEVLYASEEERRGEKPLLSEIAKVQIAFLEKLSRRIKE